MDEQQQNIQDSEITDSDLQLAQAGGNLGQILGNHNTQIFLNLVGRKQKQWNPRQASILNQMQADVEQRLVDLLNNEVLIPLGMQETLESVNRSPLKSPRTLIIQGKGSTRLDPELPILRCFVARILQASC
jgi:hypothetical protein